MVEFRPARKEDINAIVRIENECFLSPFSYNDLLTFIEGDQYSRFFVIEYRNMVVGFYIYWITFDSASVIQIALDPRFQRRGFGKLAMIEIIKDCYSERVQNITLEVREHNIAAQKLYKSVGFEEILMKEHYYSNGDNALYMIRKVDIINGNNTSF